MKRAGHYLFVRHRHNWILLFRFGLVGGSGVIVNLAVIVATRVLFGGENDVAVDLPGTDFNIRWYHVFSTIAFVFANLWNFQLNRSWTFRSSGHASWMSEYGPFLAVGLIGQVIGLLILTVLMHPGSVVSLPTDVFDDSNFLRIRLYWAQFITIALVTPLTFIFNKLWTFSSVRGS